MRRKISKPYWLIIFPSASPPAFATALEWPHGGSIERKAASLKRGNTKLADQTLRHGRTAEVTLGGVDTNALSSKTMEVKSQPGLYFIGEVVDVTGWLGGYNFQWAWSSGVACGRFVKITEDN